MGRLSLRRYDRPCPVTIRAWVVQKVSMHLEAPTERTLSSQLTWASGEEPRPSRGVESATADHGGQKLAAAGRGRFTSMTRLPHPIPYQGSKRKLAPLIATHIPADIKTFYEPFAGSAALTIHAAHHRLAERFVVADSLEPLVGLLRSIVEDPDRTADRYRNVWEGQLTAGNGYYNEVRDRYNREQSPVDLLYLICRCTKNAIRFSSKGRFSQSADKRRLGMHPDKMRAACLGVAFILRGNIEFRVGDWRATVADARAQDFVYMDPPYFGTSAGRDKRYHQQLAQEDLIVGLHDLRRRGIPFALSYDGMTGEREYGAPLPSALGLKRLFLHAGRSTQATLLGRQEDTIESLYVTPELDGPGRDAVPMDCAQVGLAF